MASEAKSTIPWYAWFLLGIGLLAVSSAATVFVMMDAAAEEELGLKEGLPAVSLAAWRLQATAIVLLPFFIWQWRKTPKQVRDRCFDIRVLSVLALSAIFLTIHFGTWLMSLKQTSLTHSLLFVTAHPLVFIIAMWMLRRPANKGQVIGVLLGLTGGAIALLDVGSGAGDVTLKGDLLAFIGAIAIVVYLAAGRHLRQWMPIFLYAFPVTLISAILLTVWSIIQNEMSISFDSAVGAFGWLSLLWIPFVLYLALGPGLFGHTGINAVLRWIPPLLVSVTLVLEPLLGSLLGYLVGVESAPGFWTWIGGPMMIIGTASVTLSKHSHRSRPQRTADEQSPVQSA
jgi:drug/metabolite transporter (DMT)-like permease